MRNILDIYKEYKIPKNLEEHMFRVASVASIISDSLNVSLDKESVISACLLHDMGNIVKFDLEKFPEFNKPEGIEYWESVKKEFKEKYGKTEHEATYTIAKEVGVSEKVFNLVHDIEIESFDQLKSLSKEMQIRIYADFRVGPFGVISLADRFVDGKERYQNQKNVVEEIERNESILFALEEYIFSELSIKPEDITDESIAPVMENLKDFMVK